MVFSIVFPFICAFLCLALRKLQSRKIKSAAVIAMQAVITASGIAAVLSDTVSTGKFVIADGISIGFQSDMTAKLFCAITVVAWLLVSVYASVYMKHEKNEEAFYLFMFLSEAAMLGAAFADGLMTMYFFYELVTLFSMPLVLHSRTEQSVAAAKKYLFYSVAGAFCALFGIFVLSQNAATLDFAAGAVIENASPLVLTAVFVMCLGFGAKAGLFPLHGWLPTAHPVAPAPASALLSGVIAKAGVLAIIRTVYFVAGAETVRGTWVQTALLILSLLTVVMGSAMAHREKIFKKRLAFSTVSQISYVLTGLFLFLPSGAEGAVWQIIFHAAVKVGLFLCAGAVIYLYGYTTVDELDGIGKKMPVTFVCFTVLALSLTGIPPLGGFFSKWYLATASLSSAETGILSWLAPVVLLLSALLTAGYLFPVSIKAFWSRSEKSAAEKTEKEPLLITIPLIILSAFALMGGIFSEKIGEIISAVTASMF